MWQLTADASNPPTHHHPFRRVAKARPPLLSLPAPLQPGGCSAARQPRTPLPPCPARMGMAAGRAHHSAPCSESCQTVYGWRALQKTVCVRELLVNRGAGTSSCASPPASAACCGRRPPSLWLCHPPLRWPSAAPRRTEGVGGSGSRLRRPRTCGSPSTPCTQGQGAGGGWCSALSPSAPAAQPPSVHCVPWLRAVPPCLPPAA